MVGLRMYVFFIMQSVPQGSGATQPIMTSNGLSAVRSSVAGIRERTMRSTAAPEAVAELGR